MSYCYNLGNITDSTQLNEKNIISHVGGIVGVNNAYNPSTLNADINLSSVVSNCYVSASMKSFLKGVGGIVGYNSLYSKVMNSFISKSTAVCYNSTTSNVTADMNDSNYNGRLIGQEENNKSTTYVSGNGEKEDNQMPTVYNIMNNGSDSASTIWDATNVNAPTLLWEANVE